FFRLAAHKFRQVLLDMAQRESRRAQREVLGLSGAEGTGPIPVSAGTTYDPARLALWSEFHEKVATLSEQERAVFEMHYYLELPQAEIARVMELHPRKVSYLWIAATEKLGEGLDDVLRESVRKGVRTHLREPPSGCCAQMGPDPFSHRL